MADRTVKVELLGKGQSLVGSFKDASQGAKGLRAELDELGQKSPKKFNDIAMAAGGVGIALLGIAAYAVKASMDFDKQMSEVSAVSGATATDLQALRQAALDAGRDTMFSATEAAKGEAELSKAGVTTADIMGGALKGSLSLAAAGQMDLAASATIAAQTMNIFELRGKDVSHIADVLASAANTSAADMQGLGQGLQQVGLVAHQAGFSLEETVGILAAFADRGLQGSDGATSLKTAIQRLVAPTAESAAAMRELGINVYDSNGHVKHAADIAQILKDKLSGLSESQRNAAMTTIFGSDAIRAANVLYGLGADGVNKYTAAVDKNGAAAETARKKMDNLAGDLEQLRGSLETLAISSGSGANSGLRILVQTLTGLTNAFLGLPGPVQSTIVVLAGVSGAGLLATAATMKIRQHVLDVVSAFKSAGPAGEAFIATLGKIGRVAGPIGLAVGAVVALDMVISAMSHKWAPVEVDLGKLSDGLKFFNDTGRMTGEVLRVTGGSWDTFAKRIAVSSFELGHMQDVQKGVAQADWTSPAEGAMRFRGALEHVGQSTKDLNAVGQALADMYKSGDVVGAAANYNQLTTALREQGVSQAQINVAMKGYLDLSGGLSASQMAMAQGAQTAATNQSILNGTMQEAIDKAGSLKAAFDSLNGGAINLTQAQINVEASVRALNNALKDSNGSLDITTEKGGAAAQMALNMAKGAAEVAQKTYDQTGSVQKASEAFNHYRDTLIESIATAGGTRQATDQTREAARRLADEYLKMPPLVQTQVQAPGMQDAINKASTLSSLLNGLTGTYRASVITTYYANNPENAYRPTGGPVPQRWGGITEHAQSGLLREASVYSAVSSGARYAFAEPGTGGEAFIPKHGNRERSMAILDKAASWYGTSVGGGGASIVLNVYAGMGTDGAAVGRQVADALRPLIRNSFGGNVQVALGRKGG